MPHPISIDLIPPEAPMAFPVYDSRTDIRNVLVTSQIRSRFLRMEPGQEGGAHSHDLGHEVFLVLDGRAEFTIVSAETPRTLLASARDDIALIVDITRSYLESGPVARAGRPGCRSVATGRHRRTIGARPFPPGSPPARPAPGPGARGRCGGAGRRSPSGTTARRGSPSPTRTAWAQRPR